MEVRPICAASSVSNVGLLRVNAAHHSFTTPFPEPDATTSVFASTPTDEIHGSASPTHQTTPHAFVQFGGTHVPLQVAHTASPACAIIHHRELDLLEAWGRRREHAVRQRWASSWRCGTALASRLGRRRQTTTPLRSGRTPTTSTTSPLAELDDCPPESTTSTRHRQQPRCVNGQGGTRRRHGRQQRLQTTWNRCAPSTSSRSGPCHS